VTDPDPSAAPAARPSSTIRLALLATIVVAISAAAFLPTLGGGFVNWDDDVNFTTNPGFRGLGPAQLRWMFTTTLTGHWIPLTWLTLGANYALGGMDPWGYHLVNVLVHAAAAGVFFLVARGCSRPRWAAPRSWWTWAPRSRRWCSARTRCGWSRWRGSRSGAMSCARSSTC
jgi:hypothetical protein